MHRCGWMAKLVGCMGGDVWMNVMDRAFCLTLLSWRREAGTVLYMEGIGDVPNPAQSSINHRAGAGGID